MERAEEPVLVSEARELQAALTRAAVGEAARGNVTKISAFIRRFELEHNLDKLHFIALHCASFLSHASDFTPGMIT